MSNPDPEPLVRQASPAPGARPALEVRGARASSVIVQRIDPGDVAVFMDWQRGISAAAAEFPGYQTTEIYPPLGHQKEWVVILHFDDQRTLQNWLDSPTRAEWIAKKLPRQVRDFRLRTLPSGFGPWFAGLTADGGPLPHWKMILTVLFGLYPTVMLLVIFLSPLTKRFGMSVAMLLSNAASVCFLEFVGTPVTRGLLRPWLRAGGQEGRRVSLIGSVLILAALGVMTALFSLVVG
jgi:antibiotic biosynthesis monooxygenase (ABM) superfamily enzyme